MGRCYYEKYFVKQGSYNYLHHFQIMKYYFQLFVSDAGYFFFLFQSSLFPHFIVFSSKNNLSHHLSHQLLFLTDDFIPTASQESN